MIHDAIVIGAGTAGAVVAHQLARAGARVLMVGQPPSGFRPGEGLPAAAAPLLRHLGLSQALTDSAPVASHGNVSSWGDTSLQRTDFIRDPHGSGWHLDRPAFDACLLEAALEAGARLDTRWVSQVARSNGLWRLGDGQCAGFLVDASGRSGQLGRRLGIARHRDPGLTALYAVTLDTWGERSTLIESVPEGWWYTAPLPGERRIAVLHLLPREAAAMQRQAGAWQRCLGQTLHVRLACPHLDVSVGVRAVGANGSMLKQVQGDGWIAVGDAAIAFDPLSSQGIFNALYTASQAGQAIVHALEGDCRRLHAYPERLRSVRECYLACRRHLYLAERRWPRRAFWQHQVVSDPCADDR